MATYKSTTCALFFCGFFPLLHAGSIGEVILEVNGEPYAGVFVSGDENGFHLGGFGGAIFDQPSGVPSTEIVSSKPFAGAYETGIYSQTLYDGYGFGSISVSIIASYSIATPLGAGYLISSSSGFFYATLPVPTILPPFPPPYDYLNLPPPVLSLYISGTGGSPLLSTYFQAGGTWAPATNSDPPPTPEPGSGWLIAPGILIALWRRAERVREFGGDAR